MEQTQQQEEGPLASSTAVHYPSRTSKTVADPTELVGGLFSIIADFYKEVADGLNEGFSLQGSLPYGKWIGDTGGLCLSLARYDSEFQPRFNQLAMTPQHSIPVNPLTGCPEAKLVPDLLFSVYPPEVEEEHMQLQRYFRDSYNFPSSDKDVVSSRDYLFQRIETFNSSVQRTMDDIHTSFARPSDYKSSATFGIVLSEKLKTKPKDHLILEDVSRSLLAGTGFSRSTAR